MVKRSVLFVAALLLGAAACTEDRSPAAPPATLPAALSDPSTPPDPELLLPPLEGYRVDDGVDAREVAESLAHGSAAVAEVARRLIRDDQGFTAGDVTVVTTGSGPDDVEDILRSMFGDAPRRTVDIAGVPMLRIPVPAANDVLAWPGESFLVVFTRAQEQDHAWLEELARASVRSVRERH